MSHGKGEKTVRHHEAMATRFTITLANCDQRYAVQAAAEAYRELDRLEGLLSRSVPHSDITHVQRSGAGKCILIDVATHACLRHALRWEQRTGGAFNIGYRHGRATSQLIRLIDSPPSILVLENGVELDLGGIAKGFALDHIATLLCDWDLRCFLLRASRSTLLAGDPPPGTRGWAVRVGPAGLAQRMLLKRAAVSGSGTAVQGAHIIDPHTGKSAGHFQSTWAFAPQGVHADAISTAMMVMDANHVVTFARQCPDCLLYGLPRHEHRLQAFQDRDTNTYR